MNKHAFTGARIFDGSQLYEDNAVLLDGSTFHSIVSNQNIPDGYAVKTLNGGLVMPGFVDLQVNGGDGIMFNDDLSPEGLGRIAKAHATMGTSAFLATLITDTPARVRAAVDAVEAAIAASIPGVIGIHLEGPHLSPARKGAHDPALIRPMEAQDEAFLLETVQRIPNVFLTLAPESVSTAQIERLSQSGIIVSLGHTDCSFAQARSAFQAGARCVTHLFNAMSQLGNREPGLVGAALYTKGVSAGLIADGFHVHSANIRMAIAAKESAGGTFLVTDAMAPAGTELTEFGLNGRNVSRKNGQLKLQDGTLAGADVDFPTALSLLVNKENVPLRDACAMATSVPAALLPSPGSHGRLLPGQTADLILLDENLRYQGRCGF